MPPAVEAAIGRAARADEWVELSIGMSGDRVWRVGDAVVKAGGTHGLVPPAHEADRLRWLAGKLPVPEVRALVSDGSQEWLVTSALPGVDAAQRVRRDDLPAIVDGVAAGLRLVHAVDWSECPFDASTTTKLAAATARAAAGAVDVGGFADPYRRHRVEELLAVLEDTRPAEDDRVFCHGDYCLPNVLLDESHVTGFVDWGRAGVGDRYLDLALAARSIVHNTGNPALAVRFFESYGIDAPDGRRVEFFVLLDEFF